MWADRPDENASFPGTCESFGLSLSESRVRENRMHGLMRVTGTRLYDMRLLRHGRGNPDTDYSEI